ncbi:MAG: hypothetical protein J5J06_20160 [Phycisphaerae bacterium]|nr:hypothetical protein [Phycisphaerae bacterium]
MNQNANNSLTPAAKNEGAVDERENRAELPYAQRRNRVLTRKRAMFWICFTLWLACILVGIILSVYATFTHSDSKSKKLENLGFVLAVAPILVAITIAQYPAMPWKLRLGPKWVRLIIWGFILVGLIVALVALVWVLRLERSVQSS